MAEAIAHMKRGKATGPDDVSAEMIKALDKENRNIVLDFFNEWWWQEAVPEKLVQAVVVSLYKKGDPKKLENYRPISLLNAMYKLFAIICKKRLEEGLENWLWSTQFGFRAGKSIDQVCF